MKPFDIRHGNSQKPLDKIPRFSVTDDDSSQVGRDSCSNSKPMFPEVIVYQPLAIKVSKYKNKISTVGRTEDGKSVIAHIIGFRNYFYVDATYLPTNASLYMQELKLILKSMSKNQDHFDEYIDDIEFVSSKKSIYGFTTNYIPMYKVYARSPSELTRAEKLVNVHMTSKQKNAHDHEISSNQPQFFNNKQVEYTTKFYTDTGFRMLNWCILKKFKVVDGKESENDGIIRVELDYTDFLTVPFNYNKEATDRTVDPLRKFEPQLPGGWDSVAPFTVLILDIECINAYRPDQFPDSAFHSIGAVSLCHRPAIHGTKPFRRIVLTCNRVKFSRAKIDSNDKEEYTVESFSSEFDLLLRLAELIKEFNPDVMSGYNADQFDFPYLKSRADILIVKELHEVLSKFPNDHQFYINDFMKKETMKKEGKCAVYSRNDLITEAPGFAFIDVMKGIKVRGLNKSLNSYKLDYVAPKILKNPSLKKKIMPPNKIGETYFSNPDGVSKLAEYCMWDTDLASKLWDMDMFVDFVEKSRLFITDINTVINRGQCIRGMGMYTAKIASTRGNEEVFPDKIPHMAYLTFYTNHSFGEKSYGDDDVLMKSIMTEIGTVIEKKQCHSSTKVKNIVSNERQLKITSTKATLSLGNMKETRDCVDTKKISESSFDRNGGYSGASVLDMTKGFFPVLGNSFIIVHDFNSLYPRLLIGNNICVSTLVELPLFLQMYPDAKVNEDYIIAHGTGAVFVTTKHRMGLIPQVAYDLLKARSDVRKEYEKESDSLLKNILDIRQQNYKQAANSLYGLCGASNSKMPAPIIAASICSIGRFMIGGAKYVIEKIFPDSRVIYGDTDSTFTEIKETTFEEAFKRGQEIADVMNCTRNTTDKKINRFLKLVYTQPEFMQHFPQWLGLEKVIANAIMIQKKKYVGRIHKCVSDTKGELFCKGIETVRGDTTNFVKAILGESLTHVVCNNDIESGIEVIRKAVAALHADNGSCQIIPPLLYCKTGLITSENYKGIVVANEVRKRMMKSNPSNAPVLGDKFQIIFCNRFVGCKKASEKAVELGEFLDKPLPVCKEYYLNALKQSIDRVWVYIMDAVKRDSSLVKDQSLVGLTVSEAMFDWHELKIPVIMTHNIVAAQRLFAQPQQQAINSILRQSVLDDDRIIKWDKVPYCKMNDDTKEKWEKDTSLVRRDEKKSFERKIPMMDIRILFEQQKHRSLFNTKPKNSQLTNHTKGPKRKLSNLQTKKNSTGCLSKKLKITDYFTRQQKCSQT